MTRAVVCVATTPHYQKGMRRLFDGMARHEDLLPEFICNWGSAAQGGWPMHWDVPYAFKACAMKSAADEGADLILWADSCIVPIRSMEPLWERIERDGYWMSHNGYSNYEWTADSAYPDLFQEMYEGHNKALAGGDLKHSRFQEDARAVNLYIPHVVATCFGLNVRHEKGRAFLDEYFRLATQTKAFCGPWINSNYPGSTAGLGGRSAPCGPPDVRGHRHDQTAASVLAWRLGFELTSPPDIIAYPPGRKDRTGWVADERTILLADGDYE